MAFGRQVLRLARFTAWMAGIVAALVGLLTWFNSPSQSKEPNQPIPPTIQSPPVVIVQPPVVIVQAPEYPRSIPPTYYRSVSETPSPSVKLKEAPLEPQPKVESAINAHSPIVAKPRLSESSSGLLYAAGAGSHDSVKQWLVSGANPNAVSDYGKTPLMLAAENGHHDICRTLILRGALTNITDQRGRNALHYAAEGGHNDLVKFLLDHQIQADAVDNEGNTPLALARRGGHRTCAQAIEKLYR